ncbi:hypothetical protein PWO56_05660 [Aeromonas hydrophila]|nr:MULTISPECIES: hypothetical protein [Aeromonas]MDX7864053.1 hypothetical protein [Aeromonas caviae]WEA31294.1 hypothetical protein PWO56_05660 [Aeromonas hydrophila]
MGVYPDDVAARRDHHVTQMKISVVVAMPCQVVDILGEPVQQGQPTGLVAPLKVVFTRVMICQVAHCEKRSAGIKRIKRNARSLAGNNP